MLSASPLALRLRANARVYVRTCSCSRIMRARAHDVERVFMSWVGACVHVGKCCGLGVCVWFRYVELGGGEAEAGLSGRRIQARPYNLQVLTHHGSITPKSGGKRKPFGRTNANWGLCWDSRASFLHVRG